VEIAWLHNTTNGTTWERFVAGVKRAAAELPGVEVDDREAFLESTTSAPELRITRSGHATTLLIRWYKLQSEVPTATWVKALAQRDPPPVAIIGGGTTALAVELACVLEATTEWQGVPPVLLISTATTEATRLDGDRDVRLTELYPEKTLRYCFTNKQVAEAVLDFALQHPRLPANTSAVVHSVMWQDDLFSQDLEMQFREATAVRKTLFQNVDLGKSWPILHSIGGFELPNRHELRAAVQVAEALMAEPPGKRIYLVVPAITQPAKRFVQAVLEARPELAGRFTVLTGDGIPVYALLRDHELAWPLRSLRLPMVLFTHHDPFAWRFASSGEIDVAAPNTTEDVMHFAEMGKTVLEACFKSGAAELDNGAELTRRLRAVPGLFKPNGDRSSRSGQHVVVLDPLAERPTLASWRAEQTGWQLLRTLPIPTHDYGDVPRLRP